MSNKSKFKYKFKKITTNYRKFPNVVAPHI